MKKNKGLYLPRLCREIFILDRLLVALVLVLGLFAFSVHASNEEFRIISTRPGVTQPFLLIRPMSQAVASVVLFRGGEGDLGLSAQRIAKGKNDFLVRNRQRFADQGFLVTLADSASDDCSRTSAGHAEDIRRVILELKKITDIPVWLIGISNGTISAVNIAARLKESGPDGLVLISTVTGESRGSSLTVYSVRLGDIRVPTLLVHHKLDSCPVTPYEGAVLLMKNLNHVSKIDLLTFTGGEFFLDPCGATSYHSFFGLDEKVVAAISSWIKTTSTILSP
jgi:hypothetical protein